METCEFISSAQSVTLKNAHMAISIDTASGLWSSLTYLPLNMEVLDKGHACPPVMIGLDREWLPAGGRWQVVDIDPRRDPEGVHCMVHLRCGDMEVHDSYTLRPDRPLLERRTTAIYHGQAEKTFWGTLFRVPPITLGESGDCEVLAPGQSTRSRIPFTQQAAIEGHLPTLHATRCRLGEGRTPLGPLEPTPDFTPGVIGIHNRKSRISFMSWFYSPDDTTTVSTEGFGNSLGITHHHRVEGWANIDREYTCGIQYIALLPGDIPDALRFVQSTWAELGVSTPPDRSIRPGELSLYETSAQMEGGLSRFARELPRLQTMGINLIYLLPIWLGVPVTEELFQDDHALAYRLDPKWQRNRVPHRIISHEILDPAVGNAEDVRNFVASAHKAGIRVLFDLVFHGVAPESPLLKIHPEWFQRNPEGELFPSHDWLPSFSLDWGNPEVLDYFIDFGRRNVIDFDIDGYRIDAPFAKESNWARGLDRRAGASAFGGVRFVERLRREIKAVKPDCILLCEMPGPIWDTMCDLCNDDPFLRMCLKVARNEIKAADLQVWLADRMTVGVPGSTRILSIENHNSTRVSPSSLAYRGSPISRALFTICCFAGGIPLIWSGQEQSQGRFYRDLLQLRQSHPALKEGESNLNAYADTPDVFVAIRAHAGENLACLINCSSRWSNVTIRLPGELPVRKASMVWSNNKKTACSLENGQHAQNLRTIVEPYSSYLFSLER